jgi:hypothetical protein
MHFVDMVESIEYARFDGISTKNRTGGRKIKKVVGRSSDGCEDANQVLTLATFSLSWSGIHDSHERDKMQASRE